jgi:hypothetical protein
MPTRYLKPGIRDSEAIDALSPLTEVFYYRLLVTVDDFGRFDARPAMIKAQCFPIRDSVNAKSCALMLSELQTSGLIDVYEVDGKTVLQVCKWDNVPRAKESKYADKPADGLQMHTTVCNLNTNVPLTVTETVTETKTADEPLGFTRFWKTYPNTQRKQSKGKCQEVWKKVGAEGDAGVIVAHVDRLKKSPDWVKNGGEFIPAPLVYLNQKRWQGVEIETTSASEFAGSI